MDSWLAPKLSREAARPSHHYQAYYPQDTAYTKGLGEIEPGEVLTPSPLLSNRYDFFPLHFQYDSSGAVSSPQVPQGNWRDLAESKGQTREDVLACATQLSTLQQAVEVPVLANRVAGAEEQLELRGCLGPMPLVPPSPQVLDQNDYQSRAQVTNAAKQATLAFRPQQPRDEVTLGPLVPMWIDYPENGEARLLFVRRVQAPDQTLFSGCYGRLAAAARRVARAGDRRAAAGDCVARTTR